MTNLPKLNATTSLITLPAITCYRHPTTETLRRCNRCNRPICTTFSRQTDVGYRCLECVDVILRSEWKPEFLSEVETPVSISTAV